MIDERYRNCGAFVKKVDRIDRKVDCSHHPQDALIALMVNEWGIGGDYNSPEVFEDEAQTHLLPEAVRQHLSPKQRFAYETLRKWLFKMPSLGYGFGRFARNGFKQVDVDSSVDKFFYENASYACGDECAERAYAVQFPVSSTLDRVVGGVIGLALSPITLVVGLAYPPRKQTEEALSIATPA